MVDHFHFLDENSKKLNKKLPQNDWPDEWNTTYYKSYPRLPRIALGFPDLLGDLFTVLTQRVSNREPKAPLNIADISAVLHYSAGYAGKTDGKKRAYPSAGARYPLEVYMLIPQGNPTIAPGIYHYSVKEHSLVLIGKQRFSAGDLRDFFSEPWVQNAGAVLFITALFDRSVSKYGERGYRYALLEGGAVVQNIYLISAALSLRCCAVGRFQGSEGAVERLLDIDGVNESLLSAVVLGRSSVDKRVA